MLVMSKQLYQIETQKLMQDQLGTWMADWGNSIKNVKQIKTQVVHLTNAIRAQYKDQCGAIQLCSGIEYQGSRMLAEDEEENAK